MNLFWESACDCVQPVYGVSLRKRLVVPAALPTVETPKKVAGCSIGTVAVSRCEAYSPLRVYVIDSRRATLARVRRDLVAGIEIPMVWAICFIE